MELVQVADDMRRLIGKIDEVGYASRPLSSLHMMKICHGAVSVMISPMGMTWDVSGSIPLSHESFSISDQVDI